MLFQTPYPKTLAMIMAPCLALLILIPGLGCSSKSTPVSVSQNKTAPEQHAETSAVKASQASFQHSSKQSTELAKSDQATTVGLVAQQDNKPAKTPSPEDKQAVEYTDLQLNKNRTTLMLAFQPDVRARQLIRFPLEKLTLDQQTAGIEMLLGYDYLFQRLIQKRQEVLNVAVDGDDTAAKLRQIKIETLEVMARLRTLVYKKILTKEQQQARLKANKERTLEAKAEAEKKLAIQKAKRARLLAEKIEAEKAAPDQRKLKR